MIWSGCWYWRRRYEIPPPTGTPLIRIPARIDDLLGSARGSVLPDVLQHGFVHYRLHGSSRLGNRDTRTQSAHDSKPGGSHGDWRPNIDHLPHFHAKERGRCDANDVKRVIAKLKLAPNRAFALIEPALPQAIANYSNRMLPWLLLVLRRNHSPRDGLYAKHAKVITGYSLLHEPFWFGAVNRDYSRVGGLVSHQLGKPACTRPHFLIYGVGTAVPAAVVSVPTRPDRSEQRRRISHWKHAEQYCVGDAKRGKVRPHAESQHEDD
jgi:hypothetical protein